jgi:hypothetical protein
MTASNFALSANMEALIQECFVLHDKHAQVGGGKTSPVDPAKVKMLAKEASQRLQGTLVDLLTYRHAEKTNSNRHQGFGWSTDIISERFTASVQKELEKIYEELKHGDTH